VAVPVLIFDIFVLKVHRRESTGIDWDQVFAPSFARVATKLLGLIGTLAPIALVYWVTPEYNGTFYNPLWAILRQFWLTFLVGTPLYIFIVDGQMRDPKDSYWQLGRIFLGHWRDAKKAAIANHYLTWLVKAYYIPIMFVWLSNSTHNVVNFDLSRASFDNLRLYDFLYDFIFFIDLLFCTVGYALSLRATDSHVRTAEPTFLGWGVALFCYPPFYNLFERQYVPYDNHYGFGAWLEPFPVFRWVWAIVILFLVTVYVAATVAFGIRFSNLTHRGILTNGPYRFTKHPAYVSKNISWWMASVPFLVGPNGHWQDTIKHCLALGFINFIYFMRAKTEERHLSRDPIYVQYGLWMNEHGVLRFLNRLPVFKYKPPGTGKFFDLPFAGETVERATLSTTEAQSLTYLKGLLTLLVTGPTRAATLASEVTVPDLSELAAEKADVAWAATLPFAYENVSADFLIGWLLKRATERVSNEATAEVTLAGKLVLAPGSTETKEVSFKLNKSKIDDSRRELRIERLDGGYREAAPKAG
jgi:protein-S-isoprenylcysteine O-methyltransferase Ste14